MRQRLARWWRFWRESRFISGKAILIARVMGKKDEQSFSNTVYTFDNGYLKVFYKTGTSFDAPRNQQQPMILQIAYDHRVVYEQEDYNIKRRNLGEKWICHLNRVHQDARSQQYIDRRTRFCSIEEDNDA